jgi:hypothetical protein
MAASGLKQRLDEMQRITNLKGVTPTLTLAALEYQLYAGMEKIIPSAGELAAQQYASEDLAGMSAEYAKSSAGHYLKVH